MDNYNNGFIEEELEEDDDIITLSSVDGEEIDMREIAGIAYNGNFYHILQPVELFEGLAEDEALVFLREYDNEGNERLTIVMDDETIDAVFAEYDKLLDQALLGESDD